MVSCVDFFTFYENLKQQTVFGVKSQLDKYTITILNI